MKEGRPKPPPIAVLEIWQVFLEALDNGGLEDESIFHPVNKPPDTDKAGGETNEAKTQVGT